MSVNKNAFAASYHFVNQTYFLVGDFLPLHSWLIPMLQLTISKIPNCDQKAATVLENVACFVDENSSNAQRMLPSRNGSIVLYLIINVY